MNGEHGMEIGLLWFDSDPKVALEDKIRRAAGRYAEKFGRPATVCFLNPAALAGRPASDDAFEVKLADGAVKVFTKRQVQPHHFWVGVPASQ